jgi:rare lipoprotein A (peptidoglycan hydrolase)
MVISKKTRIIALLVLAFMLMLMTSLFSTGFSHIHRKKQKTIKKEIVQQKHKISKLSIQHKKLVSNEKNKSILLKKNTNIKKDIVNDKDTIKISYKKLDTITHTSKQEIQHNATWYRTEGTRVHKEHPEIHGTAAYNFTPRGTRLLVTNKQNGKSCVVEVTDRMGHRKPNHIDLSHSAFGALSNHSYGRISVIVKILE